MMFKITFIHKFNNNKIQYSNTKEKIHNNLETKVVNVI